MITVLGKEMLENETERVYWQLWGGDRETMRECERKSNDKDL